MASPFSAGQSLEEKGVVLIFHKKTCPVCSHRYDFLIDVGGVELVSQSQVAPPLRIK